MKTILFILALSIPCILFGQVPDANTLMGLVTATTAEKNAIVNPIVGSLVYDSDKETVYVYTQSYGWQISQTEASVYVGSFIIKGEGEIDVKGLPFQPSQITFTAHANIEGFDIDNDNGVGDRTAGLQNTHGTMTGFARDDNGVTTQQVIYIGAHGNSLNNITRFASSSLCVGIRFTNKSGEDLGKIIAKMASFNTDGFTIKAGYTKGTVDAVTNKPITSISPDDVLDESIVVLYTAYR